MLNNFFVFSLFFSPIFVSAGIIFNHVFYCFLDNFLLEGIEGLDNTLSINDDICNFIEQPNIINEITNQNDVIFNSSITTNFDNIVIDLISNIDLSINFNESINILKSDFNHVLSMNSKDYIKNINNLDGFTNFEKYFECLKVVVREKSSDNFSFFLKDMRGFKKSVYENLFNVFLESDSLKSFLSKKDSDILMFIVNKKISQL